MNIHSRAIRLKPDLDVELARISSQLHELADQISYRRAEQSKAQCPVATARLIYRARRLRDDLFPSLMGEPAWDLLLDLYIAKSERRLISVHSACIAASVSATTALRWLAILQKRGLIVRRPDPEDGRRVFVMLSDSAHDLVTKCLAGFASVD